MLVTILTVSLCICVPTLAQPLEARNYFSDFDVESLNPFNWWWNSKNLGNDVKSQALFAIIECLVQNSDPSQCSVLVEKARPMFVRVAHPAPAAPAPLADPAPVSALSPNPDNQISETSSAVAPVPAAATNHVDNAYVQVPNGNTL